MKAKLSLCWGTLEDADLATLLEQAAQAGFRAVTLNTILCEDAFNAGLAPADLANLLSEHELEVSNIDPTPGWLPDSQRLPGDEFFSRLSRSSVDAVFELAHCAGTTLINAPAIFAEPDSEQVIIDHFGILCDRAGAQGLRVALEFMPINRVPDFPTATRILSAVNASNAGLMLDCWHFHRTGGSLDDLGKIPASAYLGVQIDDVLAQPMDDVMLETLNHRLLPGEGHGDVAQILQTLHDMGAELTYDVEVFNDELRKLTFAERAQRCYDAAVGVLPGPVY